MELVSIYGTSKWRKQWCHRRQTFVLKGGTKGFVRDAVFALQTPYENLRPQTLDFRLLRADLLSLNDACFLKE